MPGAENRTPALALFAAVAAAVIACLWFACSADPDTALPTTLSSGSVREPLPGPAAVPRTVAAPPTPAREAADPGDAAGAPRSGLAAAGPTTLQVRGRVLSAAGAPVPGADVRASGHAVTTDRDGNFRIDVRNADDHLVATHTDQGLAVVERVLERAEVRAGEALDVVLPGRAFAIDGWLVTADGSPCRDWHLMLWSGTTDCGDTSLPKLSGEDFAAGATTSRDRLAMPTSEPMREPNPNQQRVPTDGAFRIGGLRQGRNYVLRAWNTRTLQTAFSMPIPAGTVGYRFALPAGEWRERVYGRAIDRSGGPIVGVRVRVTMREHVSDAGETYQTGQEATTDSEGRFTFAHVVRQDLLLRFDGDGVVSSQLELRGVDAGEDLLVPLVCRCRFRFEPDPALAVPTSVRVIDLGERALPVTRVIRDGQSERSDRLIWPGGNAQGELSVSDAAAWLVLEVAGIEVRRVPLWLDRAQVATIRG